MDSPAATIVISTYNRKDELCAAVASTLHQSVPLGVQVIDDGSTHGTAEMVRAEFPSVALHHDPVHRGYVVHEPVRRGSPPLSEIGSVLPPVKSLEPAS